MLEEMREKFEDSFTDEEKIQIFNLIYSGYYSLSYIRFLAQKKAGRDLGLEVKEPQNLLPPEGEGADYDDYLDAILKMPNKDAILENPNKPETDAKEENEETVETPNVDVSSQKDSNSIDESPISSSPLQDGMNGELPGSMGPDSSLGGGSIDFNSDKKLSSEDNENKSEEEKKEEEPQDIEVKKEEEKDPLVPDLGEDKKAEEDDKDEKEESSSEEAEKPVIEFGVADATQTHEPTVEVIQEDSRPKKEVAAANTIKFVMPNENGTAGETEEAKSTTSDDTIVIPQSPISDSATTTVTMPTPDPTPAQPSQEVPTISIDQLTNPTADTAPAQ